MATSSGLFEKLVALPTLWIAVGLTVIVTTIYVLLCGLDAYWTSKTSPHVPMFECRKHGLIPDSTTLKLSGATDEPIAACPFCLNEKMKAGDRGKLK